MHEYIRLFIPLVDFIAAVIGDNCEVVLHDLSDLEHTIVAIANGSVTQRKVGDTITEFVFQNVFEPQNVNEPFIANYRGQTSDGKKVFKSSTYYIHDDSQKVIGLLCINVVINEYLRMKKLIDQLVKLNGLPGSSETNGLYHEQEKEKTENREAKEVFFSSKDEMLSEIVKSTIRDTQVEPNRMVMEEKQKIVEQLQKKGVFNFKRAVPIVAEALCVSEQTVYRYLRNIR